MPRVVVKNDDFEKVEDIDGMVGLFQYFTSE